MNTRNKIPVLITIPHSTTFLPEEIKDLMQLNEADLARYYDAGSSELFSLEDFHVIAANYSRLYCDLNRDPKQRSGFTMEDRKGVILNKTYWGKDIYKEALSKEEYSKQLKEHKLFFTEIEKTIKEKNIKFFISAHTMYSHPLQKKPTSVNKRKDIILSNNDHQTCDEQTINIMKECFEKQAYSVEINDPFKGGYQLIHFCDKNVLPGIQIEFRISNVGNEKTLKLDQKKVAVHRDRIDNALIDFYQKKFN